MVKLSARYLWFKLALVVGSLLGLLLLYESFTTYYQVSRIMVLAELRREAQRQANLVARDVVQVGFEDTAKLRAVLDELHHESPNRIAWIRVIGPAGATVAQSGTPVGSPPRPRRPQEGMEGPPPTDIRSTPEGRVMVTVLPLRARRPLGQPPQMQAPPPGPGLRMGPRSVEIALYLEGASATFGTLLTSLIVNSTAALGLVASMVLLWLHFPNYVRGKQLEQQTELARQVQTDLLPPPNLIFREVDFAAECLSAWQVGGDFYDVFSAPDGRIAIVLGDVSGKGLPASVVAGLLVGAIRSSPWLRGSAEHEAASADLSELLRTRTSVERFASLFWCYYDPDAQVLRYVNAGHLPPLVASRSGNGEIEIRQLEDGGPVLGVLPGAAYRQGSVSVSSGDLLVLYSDGVVEATNSRDEQFGEARLQAVVRENAARPAGEIRDEILREVESFLGKQSAQDDLTLVVARLQGAARIQSSEAGRLAAETVA
ncbi:MAG TPA: PP2C family protein-serine/threonine phosphatase [Bryobacteraceae bacterium]|nr:PP2C family protein-serine/threonine phosphatase [Bryobacteraceae bacterium]